MPTPSKPFVKLANPATYVACAHDLVTDSEARIHWVAFFKRHLNTILKLGIAAAVARGEMESAVTARAAACQVEFDAHFDAFAADPVNFAARLKTRPNILVLDQWRDTILRRHGFVDAFIDLKNRENEKALPLLPMICRQLDEVPQADQLLSVLRGVFAGNIFDMGAEATAKAFLNDSPDFFSIKNTLAPRPWLIDSYDALRDRIYNFPVHRKAVFFIDNAGSDFVLGAMPMMRWLARRGTTVILAANERPTLNDMTIHDIAVWWPRIVAIEPSLGGLPIQTVSTGTGEPLIDLGAVSEELNAAAGDADLVILEGMGRGVESNLHAEFNCDALNLAMIKDPIIARQNGGKLYDIVCRFR